MPTDSADTKFWPSYLILELTTRCNLRCLMCAINADPRIQKGGEWYGDLSLEAFDNLTNVIPMIQRIDLNGHGESLLSPHFLPILAKVKAQGAYVGITSNALLMGEEVCEAIVRHRMDEIIISIHAATPESYARISRNGKLATLIKNITTLNQLKEKHATPCPAVTFNFVGMKSNIAELVELVRLANELKVKAVAVLPLAEYDNVKGESLDSHDLITYIPPAYRLAKECGVELTIPKTYLDRIPLEILDPERAELERQQLAEKLAEEKRRETTGQKIKSFLHRCWSKLSREEPPPEVLVRDCLDPWDFFFVMQSGRVRPCCIIEENMGNLSEQPFEEIWFGEKYQKLRRDILNNTPPPQCKTCINRALTPLDALREKVQTKIANLSDVQPG